MKYILPLAAFATAVIASPAMAQSFEKEEQRAGAAVDQMRAVAANLKKTTNGASAEQLRAQFNKPAAKDCAEHGGDCHDCAETDCADCPKPEAAKDDCADCAEGLCKEKGHS